jgi:FK506-binding protein 1
MPESRQKEPTPTPLAVREVHESKVLKAFKRGETTTLEFPCGTKVETIAPGDGLTFPEEGNNLRIHYDATVLGMPHAFDSSRSRGAPLYFVLGTGYVLKKVEQILTLMSFGQHCRITLPPVHAYGTVGYPPTIPGNATIVYDVELRAIQI